METVKLWVMSICISAIVGAVVLTLCPNGAMEKSVKTVVSIFLISSMLLPLINNEKTNLNFDISESEEIGNGEIDDTVASAFEENLKNEIQNTLEKNNIKVTKIEVSANIDNNEITVNKIEITVDEKDVEKANTVLENQLDLVAQIKGE